MVKSTQVLGMVLRPERKAKEEGPKKAPKRRATGREAMIAQRYMDNEKRKKEGGSSVVGS
jgi:hypothetical protein